MEDDFPGYKSMKNAELGIKEVDVSSIVGVTKLNQPRFNDDWTPTERGADQRMLYVLEYVQKNGALPEDRSPIELVHVGGTYYVDADGCRSVISSFSDSLFRPSNAIFYFT